jgi:tetratricopeptide (TPR) repeat protein
MPIGEELPGMRVARLRIESLVSPFSETVESDWGYGRFRFDEVPEGFYILSVTSRLGETRRVIEVRSTRADELGRIDLAISLGKKDGKSDLKRRFTVRASELLVSRRSKEDYLAAEAYARIGNCNDAIPLLERAVRESPPYVAAWTKLGMIAFHSDQLAQAERYIRRGLEYDSSDYGSLFALGRILMALNRPQEALPYNRAALEQWPWDALSNAQYGLNLLLVGDRHDAAEYLDNARRLDPENLRNPKFWAQVYPLKRVLEILCAR